MNDTQTAFSMLLEDMKEKGQTEIVDLLRKCDYGFVETGYDNWDGGTYFYTLYIYLRLPIINNLSSEQIKEWQDVIANSAGRFFDEGNISLSECRIVPFKELFIDWGVIIEHCSPKELIDRVVNESRLLILCATGTSIAEIEAEYKENHQKLVSILSLTKGQDLIFSFESLWQWYEFYKNDVKEDLSKYGSRRKYVLDKYNATVSLLQKSYVRDVRIVKRSKTDWEVIENSLAELNVKIYSIKDKMTFNEIGVRCRETIIALANQVYNEKEHFSFLSQDKQFDSKGNRIEHISDTDAYRKLDCYVNSVLSGGQNVTLRGYAKSTIDLANSMTHIETGDFVKAKLCINATMSLVDMVYSIYKR